MILDDLIARMRSKMCVWVWNRIRIRVRVSLTRSRSAPRRLPAGRSHDYCAVRKGCHHSVLAVLHGRRAEIWSKKTQQIRIYVISWRPIDMFGAQPDCGALHCGGD